MAINPNLAFIDKQIKRERKRLVVLQGGTRSGKTYATLHWLIRQALEHKAGMVVSIVRATLPSLKATALRDFVEILTELELYDEANHNKTEQIYTLNTNTFEFFSIDNAQKIRGRKRDILFINEANELELEDYRQLAFRTIGPIILDYNPSMFEHWIYDFIHPREDAALLITTYKDNPNLPESIIREIQELENADPEYFKVFGLGERGQLSGLVFTNWEKVPAIPPDARFMGYGQDFGFSADPAALVGVWQMNKELYVRELVYDRGLTNQDLAKKYIDNGVSRSSEVIADSAEPKSIEEIRRLGFNIKPAAKGADSIRASIDILRRFKINITADSPNMLKEFGTYTWRKDKQGKQLDEPVDFNNHAIDALRYFALNKLNVSLVGRYSVHQA